MTGVILVVDDVPANVKLLEAKLTNEYYDVITARDGYEAIRQTKEHKPDLILLDVMMPGMDGFETCSQIKKDPEISHIPIVMVTALSEPSDRVQGLSVGADDFITKPINDAALFARVKSLVRMKVLIDELRLRDQSGSQMGLDDVDGSGMDVSGSTIFVIDDDAVQAKRIREKLDENYNVTVFADHEKAMEEAKNSDIDLLVISTMLMDIDGLRLATQFKAVERLRHVPILMLVDEDDQALMLKALDLGVNDYLVVPVDYNEMSARVQTQARRKKYQDALKSNYQESVSMAITDALTGLYNRHYLDTHLSNLVTSSLQNVKPMSLMIMDMDHFKMVNDNYGHDVGDEVLRQLSKVIVGSIRSADLASRFGGEEFVVLMPETDMASAYAVAERTRQMVEAHAFAVKHEVGTLHKTVSIGVSSLKMDGDSAEQLLKRADNALYDAKHNGRNRVLPVVEGASVQAEMVESPPPLLNQTQQVRENGGEGVASLQPLAPGQPLVPREPAAVPQSADQPPLQQAPMFNPSLHQQPETPAAPVQSEAVAPMPLAEQSNTGVEPVLYELQNKKKSTEEPTDNSPIDDEPPGTF